MPSRVAFPIVSDNVGMRKVAPGLFIFALLFCVPVAAEDPIYGLWRMREDAQNTAIKSETMKVEEVEGGTRFSMDVVMAKSKLSYYYITKLDGQTVRAVMKKKPFSQVRVKKISPFEYETTILDLTTEQNYKTTISP